ADLSGRDLENSTKTGCPPWTFVVQGGFHAIGQAWDSLRVLGTPGSHNRPETSHRRNPQRPFASNLKRRFRMLYWRQMGWLGPSTSLPEDVETWLVVLVVPTFVHSS